MEKNNNDYKVIDVDEIKSQLDNSLLLSNFKTAVGKSNIERPNLLFEGPTGIGKTGVIREWIDEHKDKINPYYLDGCYLKKVTSLNEEVIKNDLKLSSQLFSSDEIDKLSSLDKLVVVIDNFNLLSNLVKNHIYLLSDGYVIDNREDTKLKEISNLLFYVIVITNDD